MIPCHRAALDYLDARLSVIPVHQKRPLVAWKPYQERCATPDDVASWFHGWPHAGVGIVCGRISRLVVVDADPRNGDGYAALAARIPPTPTVETGGGGCHHWFLAGGARIPKVPGLLPGLDLQAESSYIVAPPSIHPSGRPYRWAPGLAFGEIPLAPLPSLVYDLIRLRRERETARPVTGRTGLAGALTLDGALERLESVQRVGGQWVARCPVHDDREPSLSLAMGTDGRLLAHCFAGCTFADIVHALIEGIPA